MDRDDGDQRRQREHGHGGDRVEPELLREGLPPGLLLGQAGHDGQVDQVVDDPGQGDQTEVAGVDEVGAFRRPAGAPRVRTAHAATTDSV